MSDPTTIEAAGAAAADGPAAAAASPPVADDAASLAPATVSADTPVGDDAGPDTATDSAADAAPTTLREALWCRRWLFAIAGWGLAALLLFLSDFGDSLNPLLSLTGLFVGFLVGLTGMGGGALMTPILILFFNFQPSVAIGTDIAYAGITKIFGSWRHYRHGSVDVPLAFWLAAGSIPFGLLGATAIAYLARERSDIVDAVLYRSVGVALIVVGVLLAVRVWFNIEAHHEATNLHLSWQRKLASMAIGAGTGLIIGLTSVGSGTLLAMFLILFYPLAPRRIVGTDVFHATMLLGVTGLAQLRFGNVDLWMVASLLIGSVPGVMAGSHLTIRAPTRLLRICLAIVLFLSGVAMLAKV
jgi:hypothetical protein